MMKRIIAMLLTVTMCAELLAGCGTAVSIITVGGIETVPVERTVSPADYTANIVIRDNGYTPESDQTERLYCVTENTDEGVISGYLREAADASLLSSGKSIVGAEITLLGADMQPLKDKNGKEIKSYSGRGGIFVFDVSEIAESYQETYYLSIQAEGYYPIEAYEVDYTDLEKYKEQKETEWGAEGGLIESAQSLSEFFDKHGVEELYEIVKNHTDDPEKFSEEYKLEELLANEKEVKAGLAQFAYIDFERFWPMVKDDAITDSWEKIETWLEYRSFTLQAVGLGLMSMLRFYNQKKSAELWEKAKDSWQVASFLECDSQFWEELGAAGEFIGEQVMLDMVLEAAINSRAGAGGTVAGAFASLAKTVGSIASQLKRYSFVVVRPADTAVELAGVGRVFLCAADEMDDGMKVVYRTGDGMSDLSRAEDLPEEVRETFELLQKNEFREQIIKDAVEELDGNAASLEEIGQALDRAIAKQHRALDAAGRADEILLRDLNKALDFEPAAYGLTVPDNFIGKYSTSQYSKETLLARSRKDDYDILVGTWGLDKDTALSISHKATCEHEAAHLLMYKSVPVEFQYPVKHLKVHMKAVYDAGGKWTGKGNVAEVKPGLQSPIQKKIEAWQEESDLADNLKLFEKEVQRQYQDILNNLAGPTGELLCSEGTRWHKVIAEGEIAGITSELFQAQKAASSYIWNYLELQQKLGVLSPELVKEFLKMEGALENAGKALIVEVYQKGRNVLSKYKADGTYDKVLDFIGREPDNITLRLLDDQGNPTEAGRRIDAIIGAPKDEELLHSKVMDELVQCIRKRAEVGARREKWKKKMEEISLLRYSLFNWQDTYSEATIQGIKSLLGNFKSGENMYASMGIGATIFWKAALEKKDHTQFIDMRPIGKNYTGVSGIVVRDSENGKNELPISGARLELYDTGDSIRVGGRKGRLVWEMPELEGATFSFIGLKSGNYCLYVNKEGYEPYEVGFHLEKGDPGRKRVKLKPRKESEALEKPETTPKVAASPMTTPSPTMTAPPQIAASPEIARTPSLTLTPSPTPEVTPHVSVTPKATPSPAPVPVWSPDPIPSPTLSPTLSPTPEATAALAIVPTVRPKTTPAGVPTTTPTVTPTLAP